MLSMVSGTNFNPRSPCGERRTVWDKACDDYPISIHAPLAGSDDSRGSPASLYPGFQSTLPLRGATDCLWVPLCTVPISIHAPLAGSDQSHTPDTLLPLISIHAPLAGSDLESTGDDVPHSISIHAPLAGSDEDEKAIKKAQRISIHAPLAGSDDDG